MHLLNCTNHITFVMNKFDSGLGQLYQVEIISYVHTISVRVPVVQ
jgi:hypothetical protein